jgi:hypothetical protein
MVQLLDLPGITFGNRDEEGKWIPGKMTGPEHVEERRRWAYFNLPFDCPAFLRVFRRLNIQKPGRKATVVDDLGTTLELSYFTFGVTVYLKHSRAKAGKPASLSILVEDSEGREVLATYETES